MKPAPRAASKCFWRPAVDELSEAGFEGLASCEPISSPASFESCHHKTMHPSVLETLVAGEIEPILSDHLLNESWQCAWLRKTLLVWQFMRRAAMKHLLNHLSWLIAA